MKDLYSFTNKIGRTTYTVIVSQSENARETISEMVKKLILADYERECWRLKEEQRRKLKNSESE